VKLEHLLAFLWLRWRLFVNQMRRGGVANAVVLGLTVVVAALVAAAASVVAFLVGLFALPAVEPNVLLYVWDGLVVGFLFLWTIGLLTQLQRSEVLSLDKFLHLPVSLSGAFFINYLGSLATFSMVVFLPATVALSLGLVLGRGPVMLVLLPLLAAFFLMVTAPTYQFQGWLATLMANPRRRRTVLVLVTMGFILICQLPNIVNILHPWDTGQESQSRTELQDKLNALERSRASGEITSEQLQQQRAEAQQVEQAASDERDRRAFQQFDSVTRILNMALPPGWLPLGVEAAAEQRFVPVALCFLGMTAVGSFSLWRAYRTTLRLYTGQFNRGKRVPAPAAAPAPAKGARPRKVVLERRLPWLSEQASAVALGSYCSLLRAPEAKMMLLSPVILALVFGSMFLTHAMDPPDPLRPLMGVGAVAMVLITMTQFAGNQFGFDRAGFRVFVLSAAPRRDILLGKNLAVVPVALLLSAVLVALVQVMYPMRLDLLLAVLPQALMMYLLFCMVTNWTSILAPVAIRPGSWRASNPKGTAFLLQLLFTFLIPPAFALALLPLGIESTLTQQGWVRGVPVCLLLSLAECVAVVYLYRLVLTWQGRALQAREQKILEVVAAKAE
jgi:hypothetical protein